MRFLLVIVTIATLTAVGAPQSAPIPTSLSSLVDASPAVILKRCELDEHIVAAYCEREPDWLGRLDVYHRCGDRIEWAYSFPKDYEEHRGHYVVSFRWLTLKQTPLPVLEVVESTHMGNGSLRLFVAEGRDLRLLLDTVVRGHFWSPPAAFGVPADGEAHFEGDHLSIEYRCPEGESVHSVCLTGSIRIEDIQGRALPTKRYQQICTWDAAQRVFEPQPPTSP